MSDRVRKKSMLTDNKPIQIGLGVLFFALIGALQSLIVGSHLNFSATTSLILLSWLLALALMIAVNDLRMNLSKAKLEHTTVAKLADFATDLYWETDINGKIIGTGGRMFCLFASHPDEMIGRHYLDVIDLAKEERFRMLTALQGQQPYSDILSTFHDLKGRRYSISLSATPRFDNNKNISGYIGIGTNVTDRVRSQTRLQHLAEHDMLTGLANRYAFGQRIARDIRNSTVHKQLALLAVDLDGFKTVNDKYGHQAGDALLRNVAKRLNAATRETDWAARLGGDEFVMVSRDLANPMDACRVAARLNDILSKPYRIGGLELSVKASIGIACAPVQAKELEVLMKQADTALYQAKADGKGCYRLYDEGEMRGNVSA